MSANIKHFSFSSALVYLVVFSSIGIATAETWYDSQGRPLVVETGKVRLQTEQDKRKTLPVLNKEEKSSPSIVKERTELRDDLPTTSGLNPDHDFRSHRFRNSYHSGFGFGFGHGFTNRFRFGGTGFNRVTFNNGVFTRRLSSGFRNRGFSRNKFFNHSRKSFHSSGRSFHLKRR